MLLAAASRAAYSIRTSRHRSPSLPRHWTAAATLVGLVSLSLPALARGLASGRMAPHTTERLTAADGTNTVVVTPRNEATQSALVVLCHGLGDSAEGLSDVAEALAGALPHCKFLLPTAPVQPVTLNGGMRMASWYDIVGLDERSNEACEGIEQSRGTVAELLRAEHEATGLPYRRMVLAGFSQGGALSLYTGLQLPADQKPAGICVMSGYLPHAAQFRISPGLEDVPVWHGHGTQDFIVNYNMAEKSKQAVEAKGCRSYTLKSYALGHSINNEELNDVAQFLLGVLPDDPACRVRLKSPSDMSIKELKAVIRRAGLQQKALGLMEKHEFVKLVQDFRDGLL